MSKNAVIIHYDLSFAKLLSSDLSNIFSNTFEVQTIKDARSICSKNKIDFLICAVQLDDGNGINFCKEIKINDEYYKTQIVIIDDNYSEETRVESLTSGAIYYFSKDFALENMADSISNVYSMTNVVHGAGTVLLLHEDRLERNFIKGLLSLSDITTYDFESKDDAIAFIKENSVQISIFLIDEIFAEQSSSSFVQQIRKLRNYLNSPILVVADEIDVTTKYKLSLLGVTDFIIRPFDTCEFFLRLKIHLKMNYILEMLDAKNKLLAIKATTDELTGLFNRRFFWEMLQKEVNRSFRKKIVYSLVMIDIDNFKSINDTYGHMVGDEVLKAIAETLQKELRKSDTVARFGGEEFIILLPETDAQQAFYVADKVRSIIGSISFPEIKRKVTVSAGVADSSESDDYEALIVISDERLYKAKNTGKNRVVYD